jgi:chromosome segregation ATPase
MRTDQQPPAFSPEDLRKSFERLQTDLNIVQSELEQALGVWRSILLTEKQEFQKVLDDREKAWAQEEAQWQKDREAYEQKVHELETYFKDQLLTTEKRAVHALNELDAAWQQERSRWQETINQKTEEFRQTDDIRNDARHQIEKRIEDLEAENAQLRERSERLTQSAQDSLAKDAEIQRLQEHIASLQNQTVTIDETQKKQEEHVHVYMNTLETQVAALEDFVHQVFQPRRRKTDAAHIPPVMFRPPSSRGNLNNNS